MNSRTRAFTSVSPSAAGDPGALRGEEVGVFCLYVTRGPTSEGGWVAEMGLVRATEAATPPSLFFCQRCRLPQTDCRFPGNLVTPSPQMCTFRVSRVGSCEKHTAVELSGLTGRGFYGTFCSLWIRGLEKKVNLLPSDVRDPSSSQPCFLFAWGQGQVPFPPF